MKLSLVVCVVALFGCGNNAGFVSAQPGSNDASNDVVEEPYPCLVCGPGNDGGNDGQIDSSVLDSGGDVENDSGHHNHGDCGIDKDAGKPDCLEMCQDSYDECMEHRCHMEYGDCDKCDDKYEECVEHCKHCDKKGCGK